MDHETLKANEVKYLNWDSEFFGFSIGRMSANGCSVDRLRKELERARKEKINFVELFCDASDSESIQASEESNFHLADLRLTLKKILVRDFNEEISLGGFTFKKAGPEDIDELKRVGRRLFTSSRYYSYPKFDRKKVDLMFQTWIEKAVKGEFDDELYYLCDESGILAFNSLRFQENTASLGLFGVKQAYWGKGLGSLLLNQVSQLLHKRRMTEVNVVMQGKNSGALHLYQKNGFYLSKITLCYYQWVKFKKK